MSLVVSLQVDRIYTKALLDTGAQVILLYRDFCDKHLKHILLCQLEELEIWGIGTQKFPYDEYMPIRITFGPPLTEKTETFYTLAVVCSRPPRAGQNSLLIGTNTDLVRRLLTLLTSKSLAIEKIHPHLRQGFQHVVQEQRAPADGVVRL